MLSKGCTLQRFVAGDDFPCRGKRKSVVFLVPLVPLVSPTLPNLVRQRVLPNTRTYMWLEKPRFERGNSQRRDFRNVRPQYAPTTAVCATLYSVLYIVYIPVLQIQDTGIRTMSD